MRKDLDKLFLESITTYYFLLVLVVIIKLLGGNYFEINLNNEYLVNLNKIISTFKLENVWYAISVYLDVYIVSSITCNDNSKEMKKYILYWLPLIILIQCLKNGNIISTIIDICYILIISIIKLKKSFKKINLKNYITIMFLINILQLLSILIRSSTISVIGGNFIIDFVYNLDFLLALIIIYKLYFKKGDKDLCGMVVYYGSQKLTLLKHSLKDLHTKFQNRPKLNKEDKITYCIYLPLYLLWNLFTMFIIVIIATLNNVFEEAIFITLAFWINKRTFGKPFHFKSVATCFCFSSFTYYVLTRITFHIETSLFIPIFLGVLLSYVTSHFIKKNYKLYKGMEEQEFYDTIKLVTDNTLIIKICKEYYIDRYNDIQIARLNNYSIDAIRKKRQRVNKDLRSLSN